MVESAAGYRLIWSQIVEVLSQNGVGSYGASDSSTEILRDWYQVETLSIPIVDFWFSNSCWKYSRLLPSTAVLNPVGSVDISKLWIQVEEEGSPYEADPSDPNQADEAGGWAGTYDRRFVPIADQDGTTLIIDARPGPMQGCISEYTGAFIDESDVRWNNADSFFRELLTALSGDGFLEGRYQANFRNGEIEWTK